MANPAGGEAWAPGSPAPPPQPPKRLSDRFTAGLSGSPPQPSPSSTSEPASFPLNETVMTWFKKRNGETLHGALSFVPWILQTAHFNDKTRLDENNLMVHKGEGAVVFSDASGFTKLTERLAKKSNGAELLSQCLDAFFTPLIYLIEAYRGDVIKFSGDALTIYFQAVDDTKSPKYNRVVPPHGTYGMPDLGPMATAVLRASACCIEIHKRLHMFDTKVEDVRLCLHIGVGCGSVAIFQVGGVVPPETHVPRMEYFIAGPPIEQISYAEPLAKDGETVLSPQAWEYVRDCVIEGPPLEDRVDFHVLLRMDESKYTFPTIKHAAMENDCRKEKQFKLTDLNIIRRYVPSAVYKNIETGTISYVNEMRVISAIFVNGAGLDVMTEQGPEMSQELVSSVQRAVYAHEGTMNKFLIDDKGMLFLLVWGLPPLVHADDSTRAVLSAFDMVKVFRRLNLIGKFGITTGRSYCGLCGSSKRREYTVLGDNVNLSARLMSKAQNLGILIDEETKNRVSAEIICNGLTPIEVKGKKDRIPVFQPEPKEPAAQVGLTSERKIWFPWYDQASAGGMVDAAVMHTAAQHICSIKNWHGTLRVHELLGGTFQKTTLQTDCVPPANSPEAAGVAKPPEESPFAKGGAVVIESPTGMGKIELTEYVVMHTSTRLGMLPIFGTMGPRPGGSVHFAVELLRSTLGIFRHFNNALPQDDMEALRQLVPQQLTGATLPVLRQALADQTSKEKASVVLSTALEVTSALIISLRKQTPVVVVLQFEYGSSLFPKGLEDQTIFWNIVSHFAEMLQRGLASPQPGQKTMTLIIICKEADQKNVATKMAMEAQPSCFIQLKGLTDENIVEYLSNYLEVQEQNLPQALRGFVTKVSLGNPLYIRETIDQLLEHQHIQVTQGANRVPKCDCKDLDRINVSAWTHTAMVGGTICQIESLDPLDAAVLKMSTCFTGPFSLPDLAASTKSRWADATHFDDLRIYKSIRNLVRQSIIEAVDAPPSESRLDAEKSPRERPYGGTQFFQMKAMLMRSVGSAMLLEAQKKKVKRQALIDRALSRDLPQRMEVLELKRSAVHIPWYYEQAFRRMAQM